ncbi:hypothetical protein, partial [Achromobacter xylosoxidans]|uniref:hypothetical protein n=2 Tax=Alcaligenes xylosoxydans xylosoxydans TaxID=85698 RepID=UPI001A93E231
DLRITNALLYQLSYAGKTICFVSGKPELQAKHLFLRSSCPVYGARSGKTEIISEFFCDGKHAAPLARKNIGFAHFEFFLHNLIS